MIIFLIDGNGHPRMLDKNGDDVGVVESFSLDEQYAPNGWYGGGRRMATGTIKFQLDPSAAAEAFHPRSASVKGSWRNRRPQPTLPEAQHTFKGAGPQKKYRATRKAAPEGRLQQVLDEMEEDDNDAPPSTA